MKKFEKERETIFSQKSKSFQKASSLWIRIGFRDRWSVNEYAIYWSDIRREIDKYPRTGLRIRGSWISFSLFPSLPSVVSYFTAGYAHSYRHGAIYLRRWRKRAGHWVAKFAETSRGTGATDLTQLPHEFGGGKAIKCNGDGITTWSSRARRKEYKRKLEHESLVASWREIESTVTIQMNVLLGT